MMIKRFALYQICAFSLLFFPCHAVAEIKTFIKEYSYQASEIDSKVSCRTIALQQAKKLLLEELGTYIESHTEVKNYQLTADHIISLTAGIVQIKIIEETWNGKKYWLKARIVADPDEVVKSIESLRKNQYMKATLEKKRKESEELLNEVAILKKELELAKGNFHTEKIEKYRDIIDKLSANDWFLMGIALEEAKDYRSAIKFFDKSIELNPNYASYSQRAHAYLSLGLEQSIKKSYNHAIQNYLSAIDDSNIAIKMEPNKSSMFPFLFSMRAGIYNFLAKEYEKMGMHQKATKCYEQAVEDSDTSIKIDPSFLSGYYSRGAAYMGLKHFKQSFKDLNKVIHTDSDLVLVAVNDLISAYLKYREYRYGETVDPNTPYGPSIAYPSMKGEHLYKRGGKYNEAIEAFNEAIELDPEDAFSYYYRGRSYIHLKNYRQSFKDFSKAIELNPRNKDAYYSRGCLYFGIFNNYKQAMRDCDKCIQLDYGYDSAYYLRGNCYSKLENYQQAIKDYSKAIELDPTDALYYKGRGLAYNALGNNQQVISNFKVAARLGDKEAQDFLISIEIKW